MQNKQDTRKHRRRRLLALVVVIAVALGGVRAALPHWVADRLNAHMAGMGEYRGRLDEVDLQIWRGAYRIKGLRIEKRSGAVPVPFVIAPEVDLAVSWRHVFRGALVGEVEFRRPQLNFVDATGGEGEGQSGRGVNWRQRLESLFPVRIDEIRVRDGSVAFRNPFTQPEIDLRAESVDATLRNLTNVRDGQGRRDARLSGEGLLLGNAPALMHARFDPFGALEDFRLDLRIDDIELTRINPLARAYANLDIASGHGEFVMQIEARDGHLSGYAKPLLRDIDIADWEQDVERDRDNPLRLLWETVTDAVVKLFSNQPADQFATRISVEGRIDAPDTSTLEAIAGVLRNAFVEAYEGHFEKPGPLDG